MAAISYHVPRYRLRSKLATGVSASSDDGTANVNRMKTAKRISRLLHHFDALVLPSRPLRGRGGIAAALEGCYGPVGVVQVVTERRVPACVKMGSRRQTGGECPWDEPAISVRRGSLYRRTFPQQAREP